ncbi:MAG: hypothetical protein ABJF05_12240 [Paracoccaceae bacterium]
MSALPKSPLQVALLFDNATHFDAATPDWSVFATSLNTHLQGITAPFQVLPGMTNGNLATLGNNVMHVTLERMTHPLGMDGFGPVLAQPYYQKMRPELIEAVQEHQRAILVGVGLGSIPFPLDHPLIQELGMSDDLGGAQDQDVFERRLRVTQAAALTAMQSLMPSVVHWGQSDQLLFGAQFEPLARQSFPLPLFVHPGFHSSGRKEKDSYLTGVNAFGASHLVGKHVEFSEDAQPMTDSYASCLAYIAYARSLGHHLRDGETFSMGEDGAKIAILNLPPSAHHPHGIVRLSRIDSNAHAVPRKTVRADKQALKAALEGERPSQDTNPKLGLSLLRFGTLLPFMVLAYVVFAMSAKVPQYFRPLSTGLEVEQIEDRPTRHNLLSPAPNDVNSDDLEQATQDSQSLL